jgi:hypothetical protein
MVLPTLVYSGLSKTGNDSLIYFNLDVGREIGRLVYDGTTVQKVSFSGCAGGATNPAGGFAAFAVLQSAGAINGGTFPTGLPAKSPLFQAVETATYSDDITAYTCTFVTAGDAVSVVSLPNPANDTLICYDNGFSANPGTTLRPVPRKFNPADHYVVQRIEGTINLGDMYVSAWEGLQRIMGRRVTIIQKISAGGNGLFSEIIYYGNVYVAPQAANNPADGNASVEITAVGAFSFMARFSAAKP